jgi:hypothetical protein
MVRGEQAAAAADLVGRDFTAELPATKSSAISPNIRTWARWLYLTTVIDCFNREVIGYAMADHRRTSLVSGRSGHGHPRPHVGRGLHFPFRPQHPNRTQPVGATPPCWRNSSCSFSASAGVFQPRVLRGRPLSAAATASRSAQR